MDDDEIFLQFSKGFSYKIIYLQCPKTATNYKKNRLFVVRRNSKKFKTIL